MVDTSWQYCQELQETLTLGFLLGACQEPVRKSPGPPGTPGPPGPPGPSGPSGQLG